MSSDITIYVNDQPVTVPGGRSLVSILWGQGLVPFRANPVSGEPRAPYCGMGACFECEAVVEGHGDRRTCLIEACEGMRVQLDLGAGHDDE